MPEIVLGEGPRNAKIVLVGEAPGREEELLGRPFVGGSGKLLNAMLASAGIDRSECYLTNISKRRPPDNDFGAFYDDKKRTLPGMYLQQCVRELKAELETLSPNVIVALGAEPLRALTGRQGIDKWRGSVIPSTPAKVIPTFHPAFVLRVYGAKPIVEFDFRRVKEHSEFSRVASPSFEFELDPTFERVMEFLYAPHKRLAFDIETVGQTTRCLGFADSDNHALVIPFLSDPNRTRVGGTRINFAPASGEPAMTSHWSEDEEYEILKGINRLMLDPSIEKVAQNCPFDLGILLNEFGLLCRNLYMDTMVAQHTCYAELPKGLDFLASIYTDIPYYSDRDTRDDYQEWRYNAFDCVATYQCSYALEEELRCRGLTEFYFNHLHPTIFALARTQSRGVMIDEPLRETLAAKEEVEMEASRQKINATVGMDLNPSSPKQMHEFLYEKLKLPQQIHHKTKKPTADEDAINKLALRHPKLEPLLSEVLNWRERQKRLGTFLRSKLRNGRIYTSYNLTGAVTGRLTSQKTLFGDGGNLQQVERGGLRRIFRADDGWVLIKCDESQAEWRGVVWTSKLHRIIKLYEENPRFDCHKWNASVNIFEIPLDQVTKEQRTIAKNGVYGGNYGMHASRAAQVYKQPLEVATMVLAKYHKNVPEIREVFWKEVQQELLSTRTVENLLGRRRIFFGRLEDDGTFREAYSHKIQSLVADIINRAISLADEVFDHTECHPVLQVHDEIVFHCRADRVDHYVPLIRRCMEYSIPVEGVDVPLLIPADISVGPNWFDQKEI